MPDIKIKDTRKNECPLHWCGKWDLNPHANTDWGTWGLPLSTCGTSSASAKSKISRCGTSSASAKSKISCDSSVTVFNDSNLLICLDIKIKDTRKNECPLHWCGKWDLNPHANTDTSTSSLPVCRFQHPRKSA